jgi:hypothetical protein
MAARRSSWSILRPLFTMPVGAVNRRVLMRFRLTRITSIAASVVGLAVFLLMLSVSVTVVGPLSRTPAATKPASLRVLTVLPPNTFEPPALSYGVRATNGRLLYFASDPGLKPGDLIPATAQNATAVNPAPARVMWIFALALISICGLLLVWTVGMVGISIRRLRDVEADMGAQPVSAQGVLREPLPSILARVPVRHEAGIGYPISVRRPDGTTLEVNVPSSAWAVMARVVGGTPVEVSYFPRTRAVAQLKVLNGEGRQVVGS